MNHQNKKFLTIAIPTYNGASSYLKVVLDHLLPVLKEREDVEIVVSDNCSTDHTIDLLSNYEKYDGFRYHRQMENVGFKNNMLFIINNMVSSEYCWFVGDDDILLPNAVNEVMSFLKDSNVDYLKMGYKRILPDEINDVNKNLTKPIFKIGSYANAIEDGCFEGNAFATFMSSSVFRVKPFLKHSLNFIDDGKDMFYNTFPNAYLIAKSFCNSVCGYSNCQLVFPIIRNKDWAKSEKLYKINSIYLLDFYNYLLSLNVSRYDLRNTKRRILFLNIESGIIRYKNKEKVAPIFWKSVFTSIVYPSVCFKIIREVFGHFSKKKTK